jgi:hypothetical protein
LVPGFDGCVTERLMIEPPDGAVLVGGGAENVLPPRLPKLPPRPVRASAALATRATTKAPAHRTAKRRLSRIAKSSRIGPKNGAIFLPRNIVVMTGDFQRALCRRKRRDLRD